jgi:hypothetical protein
MKEKGISNLAQDQIRCKTAAYLQTRCFELEAEGSPEETVCGALSVRVRGQR